MSDAEPIPIEPDPTSVRVRKARTGDIASLEWLVGRFAPVLLAHATLRLGPRLARVYDAGEIVAEAWADLLPRLATLGTGARTATRALLQALTAAITARTNHLLERHLRRDEGPTSVTDTLDSLPLATAGVITAACRRAPEDEVHVALTALPAEARSVLLLRGLEQASVADAAVQLGLDAAAAAAAYQRALALLRAHLPDAVFADLPDA